MLWHDSSQISIIDIFFVIVMLIGGLAVELILGENKVFVDVVVAVALLGLGVNVLGGGAGVFEHWVGSVVVILLLKGVIRLIPRTVVFIACDRFFIYYLIYSFMKLSQVN